MILSVFKLHLTRIKNNLGSFAALAAIALITIYDGYHEAHIVKSIAYLGAVWLCAFVIDLYVYWRPPQYEFVVRNPKREGIYVAIMLVFGFGFLYFRFIGPPYWESMGHIAKLAVLPLILFVFPIAFAIVFLLLKYKPRELGIRIKDTLVALPIIAIIAGTAWLVAPGELTIKDILAEPGGIWNALFEGFLAAALAEEFWRFIVQTRFGAMFGNTGAGWIVASIIWALMHVPARLAQIGNAGDAIVGILAITPIGLLWGYMTHRTKSILPSILAHGTNVWGLQNI